MGINKSNLGVSIESVLNFIKSIAGTHNSIPGRDAIDAHPISAITGLHDKMNIIDDISVAQKTVNTRGTKELLTQEYSYNLTPATANGTAVITAINSTITLKESILNYETINIQLKINTSTVKTAYPLYSIKTSSIIFNNSNTLDFSDGSSINLNKIQGTVSAGAWGSASASFSFWFKDETHLFILNSTAPYTAIGWNNVVLSSVQGVNIENTIIDPVEYVNTDKGIEDSPVGHILSQMGKVAPKHYLICDGSIHNITEYPHLSQYIKDQFGTFNFFGGDGTTTFAVPDLRDEFLRGYHGDKTEKLSAEIGIHQDGTILPNFWVFGNGTINAITVDASKGVTTQPTNYDKSSVYSANARWRADISGTFSSYASTPVPPYAITTRPLNTTVLYCIKYEPTYFMSIQGLMEETVLWEGNIGTDTVTPVNSTLNLSYPITDYDKIVAYYYTFATNRYLQSQDVYSADIKKMIDEPSLKYQISLVWGYGNTTDFTSILNTSTYQNLAIIQSMSHITKITGVKYKTFQN